MKTYKKIIASVLLSIGLLFISGNVNSIYAAGIFGDTEDVSEILSSGFITSLSNVANLIGSIFGGKKQIKNSNSVDTSFTSCWMKNLKDDAKLCEILIPGSHDSGAYSMAPTTKYNLISVAAHTQEMNCYHQAKVGARIFDIRARAMGNKVVVNHGVVNGCEISYVLNSILKFIEENPSEIVILNFAHCSNVAMKKIIKLPQMKKIMNKSLTKSMCSNLKTDFPKLNMKELRNLKVNFILLSDYDDDRFQARKHMKEPYILKTRSSSSIDVMVNREIENLQSRDVNKITNISPLHIPTKKEFFANNASPIKWEKKISEKRRNILFASNIFLTKANAISLDALLYNEKFVKELINLNKTRNLMN